MKIQHIPGTFDIVPSPTNDSFRATETWHHVEGEMRAVAKLYGFEEIRTPILERTPLFERSSGDSSDIVAKELYRFEDKGNRDIALRPEGTAPCLRAFLAQDPQWQKLHPKLFYIGPMFRYDRPQKGRYRQHHQFGGESMGHTSPERDVEIIDLLLTLYRRLNLQDICLHINSLGTSQSRQAYLEALTRFLTPIHQKLSADSQKRLEKNPLRILDSKDPQDRDLLVHAPQLVDFLDSESQDYFQQVRALLDDLGISYVLNPQLVRGLDYYNHTVFEIVHGNLGAQSSLSGGGRYDGLAKLLGGDNIPGVGFGQGIERLCHLLPPHSFCQSSIDLLLIPVESSNHSQALTLAHTLRAQNISTEIDVSTKSLKKKMQQANLRKIPMVVCLGEDEIAQDLCILKHMEQKTEIEVPLSQLASYLLLKKQLPDATEQLLNDFDPQLVNRVSSELIEESLHTSFESLRAFHEKLKPPHPLSTSGHDPS